MNIEELKYQILQQLKPDCWKRQPTYLHQACWHHHSLRMVLYMLPLLILNT